MPRRRVLTDAQLDNLLAFPTTELALIRHWPLDEADLTGDDLWGADAGVGLDGFRPLRGAADPSSLVAEN